MNDAIRTACWLPLCDVDVTSLSVWLVNGNRGWPPVKGGQPNRIHIPPLAEPIIKQVLARFDAPVSFARYYACLSRLVPGSHYEYHRDPQAPNWITRVHVPVVTNQDAWLMFAEADGVKVHFEVGKAYSFNTLKPHCYGNDGTEDRVHLLFDVVEGVGRGV